MICVDNELVLIGTLCGTLLGFSIDERYRLIDFECRQVHSLSL